MGSVTLPVALVGDEIDVPCIDGSARRYLNLDAAASTSALPVVASRVQEFLPWYSSVHRGAGYKSRLATIAYEKARAAMLRFAGRAERADDVAIICRNTTEAINHLAYRLRLEPDDVVLTTVVEHHANLLPWTRAARTRFIECDRNGTFSLDDVVKGLDENPRPKLLAVTGASNVTGWMPPIDGDRGRRARPRRSGAPRCRAARAAPSDAAGRRLRRLERSQDVRAVRRRRADRATACVCRGRSVPRRRGCGRPRRPRRGRVDGPTRREEAGSPNVLGAVALHAAIDELTRIGWDAVVAHDRELSHRLRRGLAALPGVHLLGPGADEETLPLATFTVDGMHHTLVAARLSAEYGIGVRHGCFCAHPYLLRLLDLDTDEIAAYHRAVTRGDRREIPGAVRASAGLSTSAGDVDRLVTALAEIVGGAPAPVEYSQDRTGDFSPVDPSAAWIDDDGELGAPCAPG